MSRSKSILPSAAGGSFGGAGFLSSARTATTVTARSAARVSAWRVCILEAEKDRGGSSDYAKPGVGTGQRQTPEARPREGRWEERLVLLLMNSQPEAQW